METITNSLTRKQLTMQTTNATLANISCTEELMGFAASYRNNPEKNIDFESVEFNKLPIWLKDFVFILDFETRYETGGLFSYLSSETGVYFPRVIVSFSRTGNNNIAAVLIELQHTFEAFELSPVSMHDLTRNSTSYAHISVFDEYAEVIDKLVAIDKRLKPLIQEKNFWKNVEKHLNWERLNY